MRAAAQQEDWRCSSVTTLREALISEFARCASSNVDRTTEISWMRLCGRNVETLLRSFSY